MISGDPVENPVASMKSPVLVSRHEAIEGIYCNSSEWNLQPQTSAELLADHDLP